MYMYMRHKTWDYETSWDRHETWGMRHELCHQPGSSATTFLESIRNAALVVCTLECACIGEVLCCQLGQVLKSFGFKVKIVCLVAHACKPHCWWSWPGKTHLAASHISLCTRAETHVTQQLYCHSPPRTCFQCDDTGTFLGSHLLANALASSAVHVVCLLTGRCTAR